MMTIMYNISVKKYSCSIFLNVNNTNQRKHQRKLFYNAEVWILINFEASQK